MMFSPSFNCKQKTTAVAVGQTAKVQAPSHFLS
jgi:hypothetical protein